MRADVPTAAMPAIPPVPGLRSVLWRIHLWAALIATPFTAIALLTGMLYIFTPQIEAWRHGALDHVAPAGSMLALDDAVAAALAAAPPGWRLQAVLPPFAASDTVQVLFSRAGAGGEHGHAGPSGMTAPSAAGARRLTPAPAAPAAPSTPESAAPTLAIHLNPYTGKVIGALRSDQRFGNWSKALHSRLLQGDGWRWAIELAASATLVLLLSGMSLWALAPRRPLLPRPGVQGRARWRQWHLLIGVCLSLLTLFMVLTGLTWSQYGGAQIRAARDLLGQGSPRMPARLVSSPPALAGVQAQAQTHDHNHVGGAPAPGAPRLRWQAAWDASRRLAPAVPVQMRPPVPLAPHTMGVWRVAAADPGQPLRRFDLALDAYSGAPLYLSGWNELSWFGKATAVGIPFHRGELGWWNQALLLLFGIGLLGSMLSGWLMLARRRRDSWWRWPPVSRQAWQSAALPLAAASVLLACLAPLAVPAAVVVGLVEMGLRRRAG